MDVKSVNNKESFYIAVILYESFSDKLEDKPLYQECFALIKASCLEEAQQKALNYAIKQQVSYQNENKDTITWLLKHILDVSLILNSNFDNETDLYARFFRNYEAYYLFEPLLSGEI